MNIGIDGYEANVDHRVGIGQFSFQLILHLLTLDHQNQYTIFLPTPPREDFLFKQKNVRYEIGKPGSLWTIMQLPQLIKKHPLDLFFSPTHYAPWFTNVPIILSIMDLSYLHFPEMFRKKDLMQLKYLGGHSIRRAKKIITISQYSKNEIISVYKKNESDITVLYPGLNDSHVNNSVAHVTTRQKNPYILFVGTIQPRKNIIKLIEAFEKIQNKNIDLILAGKKGWLYEPILQRIEQSQENNRIVIKEFVSDAELISLYKNARCFVLPSLYEGFGIPVLEAMHWGCPVIISPVTSLPEVGGEAAVYSDPNNSNDIAQKIDQVLLYSDTERAQVIEKGKKQAEKFNWERSAEKLLSVFSEYNR